MQRPLLEPHDHVEGGTGTSGYQVTTATTTGSAGAAGIAGDSGGVPPNPIDSLFAGTRWRRDDVAFVYAILTLLLVLLQVWTIIRLRQ
ncbi:hypothetical protein JZX76_11500 [Haloarcula hispanica]|uniref:Uncharacterized protein n=1 Tax=Haloarcula hispanica TaxID=51589 RepID=A0A482T471_HALHI|nr:hypothetical protein [Haloarcula hispanica]MCJ0620112.1 hypothetical protein [Haloarcula hispanica]RYJ10541.1 hypothetical protein ELS20_11420 [Haloarcula hispanica]